MPRWLISGITISKAKKLMFMIKLAKLYLKVRNNLFRCVHYTLKCITLFSEVVH